ncbi:class I tRNA ligase family protein [Psychroflexus sp. CAK57W]|nr:class I tRNA ligase family protein [Psychroflexus curvus]MBZ9627010.1 class I tRNA ligase family protein [Psychroflexus curvus]MBZ9787014.1 class I tRNA ligase family protein [Psychroflexus curvus]
MWLRIDTIKNPKPYTITPPCPIHIGYLTGVYVPADIYTRYLKLKGEDVLFVEVFLSQMPIFKI